MKRCFFNCLLLFFLITVNSFADPLTRIKEVASVKGARGNQLFGYGLVVGLKGTGDKTQTVFTAQSLTNMLDKLGIAPSKISKFGLQSSGSEMKVKNVAAVLVTAELPPFIQPGSRIDVTLSSIGDCESLEGGTLVMTPLQGADGNVYAVAQGPVSIGGLSATVSQVTHMTVAHIPQGAYVENTVPVNFIHKGALSLVLHEPDFTTAFRMAEKINSEFEGMASAQTSGTVNVKIPDSYLGREVAFISVLEQFRFKGDTQGKIIINERTGTIVTGQNVAISATAVTHGNLSVNIKPRDLDGRVIEEGNSEENKVMLLSDSITVGEVARSLNALGASPTDMISIFQVMRRSGAIKARLEIM